MYQLHFMKFYFSLNRETSQINKNSIDPLCVIFGFIFCSPLNPKLRTSVASKSNRKVTSYSQEQIQRKIGRKIRIISPSSYLKKGCNRCDAIKN